MARKACIATVVMLAISGLAAWYGQNIPFKDQWPLYEALRTTAAIIFAVMGAWLSLLYPQALSRIFKSGSGANSEVDRVNVLLKPIKYSTIILASVLIIGIVAPIAKQLASLAPFTLALRGASYGALCFLTLLQLWTVLLSLWPAEAASSELKHGVSESDHRSGLLQNVQARKKTDNK